MCADGSMVAVKTRLNLWRRAVAVVLNKPWLFFSIVVIGFWTLWLASEQVRLTVRGLQHLGVADNQAPERLLERYSLFGMSILVFVWIDLIILTYLRNWFVELLESVRETEVGRLALEGEFKQAMECAFSKFFNNPTTSDGCENGASRKGRKNPPRSCRRPMH